MQAPPPSSPSLRPPGLFPQQPQHRSVQEGEGSNKFLELSAVFLVAAKSRELERKGSAGPHQTPGSWLRPASA